MPHDLASCPRMQDSRQNKHCIFLLVLSVSFFTTSFVANHRAGEQGKEKAAILSISYYIESANNSINSLHSLLSKDNYRNKITSLNNPTNSDLGFNLKTEILAALEPLLEKAKRTDNKKFREVMENLLNNPDEAGLSTLRKYLPAAAIFSTVISLVGNLVITEKKITKDDLNKFVIQVQQYFAQYERLNLINERFGEQVQRLLERSEEIKQDLHDFLLESICMANKSVSREDLKKIPVETLIHKYYDPQHLQLWLDTLQVNPEHPLYPPDAPTIVKLLTSSIKRLQKDFETIYHDNHNELKQLIGSLKDSIPNLDEEQLEKTCEEIESLYGQSLQSDRINLNIHLIDERMSTVCRIINSGK
jgi:hypothetical protein